ncbi:MAG: hypothetical protein GY694_19795 [Gammaproteobacteria bacterium]|nr:hypothetical protein [Gammaproteobacteria bacterium]
MSEEQNVNIKQRIIGALVLVSLGIIIIPILLNGGADQKQLSGDNIPVIPNSHNKVLPKVPKPLVMPAPKAVSAYPERNKAVTQVKTKKPITESTKPITVKNKPATIPKTSNTQQKSSIKKVSKPTSAKIDKAYAIQIASFSKKSNATALQGKLRKKKYKAYIESIQTSKGKLYRLRVGPYLNFDQISAIKNNIEKTFKLKNTVLVKYTP